MRPDLRGWCKVSCFVEQHSGHGAHALPQHRRQRQLSDAAKAFAVQCLVHVVPPATILEYNRRRLEKDWQRSPGSAGCQLTLQVGLFPLVGVRRVMAAMQDSAADICPCHAGLPDVGPDASMDTVRSRPRHDTTGYQEPQREAPAQPATPRHE